MIKVFQMHWQSMAAIGAIALIIVLIASGQERLAELMQFDRDKIAQGHWWRLYTGNWVHFGWYHTAMNVLGVGAIGFALFWRLHMRAWWLSMVIVPLGVGLGLYWFSMDTDIYRGFSAAAYGILMLGLLLEWRHNKLVMTVALGVLLGKIIMEQLPDYDVEYLKDQIGVAVAIDAHLWGVVVGGLLAGVIIVRERLNKMKAVGAK